jgi:hypothetical protein
MKPVDDLSKAARSALREYKAAHTPSRAGSEQALLNIQRRLSEGQTQIDWDPSDAPAPSNGAPSSAALGKWVAISGVVVVVATAALFVTVDDAPPVTRAPTAGSGGTRVDMPPPADSVETVVAPPSTSAREVPTSELRKPVEAKRTTPKPSAHEKRSIAPEPEPSSASTLREEMALLSRGQAAFNGGNYDAALAAFDEHRSRFPSGALASERELKRIATLCRMGRTAEARTAADSYARRRPGSPSATKALSICAEAP